MLVHMLIFPLQRGQKNRRTRHLPLPDQGQAGIKNSTVAQPLVEGIWRIILSRTELRSTVGNTELVG